MAVTTARRIAFLLTVVTPLLASLAPWGPIETRSFEHLSPVVYRRFNAFLILLELGSFTIARRLWSGNTDVLFVAVVAGVLYAAACSPDLAGISPISSDAMSSLLFAIEVVDTVLVVVLVVYSYWVWDRANPHCGRGETRTS